MSVSVLQKILSAKAGTVAAAKRERSLGDIEAELGPSTRDFRAALAAPGRRFVMEVKKASPSRGSIRPDLVLDELLAIYDRYADAVSVLTEERFFGGCGEDLQRAVSLTSRPLLRKDFIFDPWQIAEARWLGADAILLIVAAFKDGGAQLTELREQALGYGMDVLVEVHNEEELERAIASGADIIGINNRNLKDLSIDLAVTERLAAKIPAGVVKISESGVENRRDILRLGEYADAFLIGSSILAAQDMATQVKSLVFGRVKICGITTRADAEAALDAGASWLGFIFHEPSPRSISPEACEELVRGLPGVKVGVFVDQSIEEIVAVARRCGLSGVQLHGDYAEEALRVLKLKLGEAFLVRSISVGDSDVELPTESVIDYWLLDSFSEDVHGGTGKRFDYRRLERLIHSEPQRFAERVVLAGGLNPDNIMEAAVLGPYALDLASGVESEPGLKDIRKLEQLFAGLR